MSFHPMMVDSSSCPPFEVLVSRYPGVKAIHDECNIIYPDQRNPLQIQSLIRSWRGGPDPLDYISMFENYGDYSLGVPPHWHYVSYGLSDLHCDGRLFPNPNMFGPGKSGFGFELTFRLKKLPEEQTPPVWPARLMQCLARYVYNYGHSLLPGDHISWHQGMNLDDPDSNTELCQILLTLDPQLQKVTTVAGNVDFVQIIPVTTEELLAVQKWSVNSFLELMKQAPQCGGSYLVTDMKRVHSIFRLKPELEHDLMAGIAQDGSDLSGVNALICSWTPEAWKYYDESNIGFLKPEYQNLHYQDKMKELGRAEVPDVGVAATNFPDYDYVDEYRTPASVDSQSSSSSHSHDSGGQSSDEGGTGSKYDASTDKALASSFSKMCRNMPPSNSQSFDPSQQNCEASSSYAPYPSSVFAPNVTYFDLIHITVNLEAGFCFPLALTGRLRHGRHFTFKGINSSSAITLVSPEVEGSFVRAEKPFGAFGAWLQLYMPDSLVDAMIQDFDKLLSTPNVAYPKTFVWPTFGFGLTLVL